MIKIIAILLLLNCSNVLGYPNFVKKIPNGDKVPNPCTNNESWKGVGHLNPAGGGKFNPFGQEFLQAKSMWTESFCKADSDGDGKTNGEELGDPKCEWTPENNASLLKVVTHPGVCEPIESNKCRLFNEKYFSSCPRRVTDRAKTTSHKITQKGTALTPLMRNSSLSYFKTQNIDATTPQSMIIETKNADESVDLTTKKSFNITIVTEENELTSFKNESVEKDELLNESQHSTVNLNESIIKNKANYKSSTLTYPTNIKIQNSKLEITSQKSLLTARNASDSNNINDNDQTNEKMETDVMKITSKYGLSDLQISVLRDVNCYIYSIPIIIGFIFDA